MGEPRAARPPAPPPAAQLAFNPLDPAHREDPYPRYHALRTADPVHWSDLFQAWVLTRHADVARVLRGAGFSVDRTRFDTARHASLPPVREEFHEIAEALKRVLIFLDPPDHTRIRNLVVKAFTPRIVATKHARVQGRVDELLDAGARDGGLDWVRDFANALPVMVIAEILGVPAARHAAFKRWADDLGALLDPFITAEVFDRAMGSALEMHDFFQETFADRRARPRDDLVSALVAVEERGDTLKRMELFTTCAILLGGGHQTTTNMLGNAVWALEENPGERRRLRENPGLIGSAVEELLRYDSPIQLTVRLARADFPAGGKVIGRGDFVILGLGAANRDPAEFSEPDRLDLGRAPNRHLAFSHGIHLCPGAHLARLEIQTALGTLLRRFPDFRVTGAPPERKPTVVSRGLVSLPLAF